MRELAGKVAVVTGAASGIGRALAESFAAEGLHVVLADIEERALAEAARALEAKGVKVLAVLTDVSSSADVDALARKTVATFGAVHIVCNNAGVFSGGLSWSAPLEDYQWVLGVNLWGVIHGIRSFVPILLEQGGEAHIVNTASMAALTSLPYASIYHTSKHAVLALSECLYHELRLAQSKIGVSVLCPELTATHIDKAERNRPGHLKPEDPRPPAPESELVSRSLTEGVRHGVPPEQMAERVLRAIREKRFYILSEEAWREVCNTRLEDIRQGRNPTFSPPV